MRRSKLEMYIDILKVLAHKGPLKLTHIMYKANVNCSVLKEYLDFLITQGLVEEKTLGKKRIVYAITQRGLTVLKYFRELKIMLPTLEEELAKIPPALY
jgi:predicted transcriptional regulator